VQRRSFIIGALATVAAAGSTGVGWRLVRESEHDGDVRRYGSTVLRRRKAASDAPNVLFISIDDMNDWAGFLNNHPGTRTPNMDALARNSLIFEHAYCAAPLCLPSRTAIMFGRMPYHTHIYDHTKASRANYAAMKAHTPSVVDDIWAAGYDTFGASKIFHGKEKRRWTQYHSTVFYASAGPELSGADSGAKNNPNWISPYNGKPIGDGKDFPSGLPDFGPSGVSPAKEPDGETATWAIGELDGKRSRPFFLGVGFVLPHEPWRLPQKYFDMHPLDEVVVPPIKPHDLDDLGPDAKKMVDPLDIFGRVEKYHDLARVVQAYQAAISFTDANVGRVLNELASSPYANDTIIALWSDHGYHLGEKMHLEKMTLWEQATHVPLLLHVPGQFDKGTRYAPPVPSMDISPTIVELCGARPHEGQDSRSLLARIRDPKLAAARPPITTWEPGNYAVRRDNWRYIRYADGERELYDHNNDPNEYTNLAKNWYTFPVMQELDAFLPPR
jgi:arylsulfatase A-like enzyme